MRRPIVLAAALTLLASAAQADGNHHHHHDDDYWNGHDDFFAGQENVYVYKFGSGTGDSLADGLADDHKASTGFGQPLEAGTGSGGICPDISGDGKCSGAVWGND